MAGALNAPSNASKKCSQAFYNMDSPRQIDSVRKRYAVTLATNAVLFMTSLVTAGIVPRALGPKQLGDFSFLGRVASAFRNMFDMGSSGAFYNYNSKHEETGAMVKVYSVWLTGQVLITISLIGLAFIIGLKEAIWPGQQLRYIVWVAIFDWFFFLASVTKQLADSKGYTARAQIFNLFVGILNISMLVIFSISGLLNLGWYIALQTFASALISLAIIVWVILPHRDIYWSGKIAGHIKGLLRYFYKFCAPLAAITFVAFFFDYVDRLLLQKFGGSIEQGYFHIASSWSAFAGLFTGSFISVYKREVAHSFGAKDIPRASGIFTRYVKMLYFVTLVLAVLLAFNARELLTLIAGPGFSKAAIVLVIMAFYPVHQVYGMLGGATFYSVEETALLRNISLITMAFGILMSYFFLAPSNLAVPGLGLGSTGLALKTVIWNLLIVQVYLIYNCRFFRISPKPFWRHQIYTAVTLIAIMLTVKCATDFFIKSEGVFALIFKLGGEAFVYFAIVAFVAVLFPQIAGINREDISFAVNKIRNFV